MQLCSTVNSVQSDAKTFNYSKCLQGMLFLCLSTQINLQHVLKISAFRTCACFESCTPVINGRVNCALFNAGPNVYLQN